MKLTDAERRMLTTLLAAVDAYHASAGRIFEAPDADFEAARAAHDRSRRELCVAVDVLAIVFRSELEKLARGAL